MFRLAPSPPAATIVQLTFAVAASALLLGPTATAAPAADSPMTPSDVARMRRASEVRISPDGKLIAWVRSVPRKPKAKGDGKPYRELHVVDQAGRDRAFVHGKSHVHHVRWTPAGDGLAFISKRGDDKKPALWIVPRDGGEAHKALAAPNGLRAFALHPDGKQALFIARDKPAPDDKKRTDHGFNQRIVEEQDRPWQVFIHHLALRPRLGAQNAASEGDADKTQKPPRTKPLALALPGSAVRMAISPNGRLLAVAVSPSPRVDDVYMRSRLHIVDLTTRKVVGKLDRKGKLGGFKWSPDSKHLAVIGAVDEHDPRAGRLWLVSAAAKLVRDLQPDFKGHIFAATWRDAGTLIAVRSVFEQTRLSTIDLAGKTSDLKWSQGIVRSLTISRDGRSLAASVDSAGFPSEAFAIDGRTGKGRRLTNNNPWIGTRRLGKQEAIRWKARDGLEIGGVLVWPTGYSKGKRYPLILAVHGGPEAHVSDGWTTYYSYPGQVAAARGFFVLYPNYRGSTGRGVKFSMMGQNDYAGGEFNDLVDAAKALSDRGLIDLKRVGITGGSYGGYAAAWGATALTKHFAAAVMFVGITDQISKFGTTDIPNEMFLVHSRRWPWKHWDYMRQRSPVYHVEKARTPLLIMHGDSDTRVHPGQSLELFRYLKTIGKTPVRLVLYRGEGHGNRRASSRYDYNLRMMRWFAHYLQGKGGRKPPHRLEYGLGKKRGGKRKR